ncbi:MAG: hypothetical protein IT244_06560 [Bacteroidia bacterium]|nr:hypothetical protein [Bacteroidia bacterium]
MKKLWMVLVWSAAGKLAAGDPLKLQQKAEWDNDLYGFVPGKLYLNAGIGMVNLNSAAANKLKNTVAPNWKNIGVDGKSIWFAKAEYAVSAHSGVGLSFAHSGFDINASLDSLTKYNVPVSGTLSYRSWSLLGRYNFHFVAENRIDVYGGIGLGFRANNFKLIDNDPDKSWWNFPIDLAVVKKVIPANLPALSVPTFGAEMTIGVRYHVLPPLAVYAEFGTAKSIAQIGMTVRL